jgi:hypothetical protein
VDDYTGHLRVGSLPLVDPDDVEDELLAVFRDDMLRVWHAPAEEYEPHEFLRGPFVEAAEFSAPGRIIADRLDLIGFDAPTVTAALDRTLRARAEYLHNAVDLSKKPRDFPRAEEELINAMSAQDWIGMLTATPDMLESFHDKSPGARGWLLNQLGTEYGWETCLRLRAVLLALPDADVSLDVTWRGLRGRGKFYPNSLASSAQSAVRNRAAEHAPIIVLTEGKTDSEFLQAGLKILYPHLTDLIRFLDYEQKPEGGASAVMRTVRAFHAAGIANRIVAVLDNDTAAADDLRKFARHSLPDHIQVMRYPTLDVAREYPTLGPQDVESPDTSITLADVNGRAASIELYLGRDVLTKDNGSLRPVRWSNSNSGMSRCHGAVTDKKAIHREFRKKAARAQEDPSIIGQQDWEGLRLILDALLSAF